jgi:hypothetical protein
MMGLEYHHMKNRFKASRLWGRAFGGHYRAIKREKAQMTRDKRAIWSQISE